MTLDYLIENKDIKSLSNFKTKAKARYYYEIHNRQDIEKLSEIYSFAKANNIKLLFIWWGTNMLFAFDIFDWIIINNCLEWWSYNNETKILDSYSNENISDIAESLFDNGQLLWKRFIWLPWSIWWAVFWNAWCFWLEIENNFFKAEVLELETWKIKVLDKKESWFEYRNSIYKKTEIYFIIKTFFDLSKKVEKYHSDVDNIDFRENKQPKGNSCGSFFKNPSKEQSAGKLIEESWFKWKKIWWAYFSNIHANFLMSDDDTNYKDLLTLIKKVKENVKNKYDIDLINEVRIITN